MKNVCLIQASRSEKKMASFEWLYIPSWRLLMKQNFFLSSYDFLSLIRIKNWELSTHTIQFYNLRVDILDYEIIDEAVQRLEFILLL